MASTQQTMLATLEKLSASFAGKPVPTASDIAQFFDSNSASAETPPAYIFQAEGQNKTQVVDEDSVQVLFN